MVSFFHDGCVGGMVARQFLSRLACSPRFACTNPIGANKGYASENIVFISKTHTRFSTTKCLVDAYIIQAYTANNAQLTKKCNKNLR
jgi:hypothetical protein